MPTIIERIAKTVADWPHWSKAERKRIPAIIEEVVEHCKTGNGNTFITEWCGANLPETFTRISEKPMPSVPDLLDVICNLVSLVHDTCEALEEESPGAAECGYWNHDQKTIYESAKELLRKSNRVCPED